MISDLGRAPPKISLQEDGGKGQQISPQFKRTIPMLRPSAAESFGCPAFFRKLRCTAVATLALHKGRAMPATENFEGRGGAGRGGPKRTRSLARTHKLRGTHLTQDGRRGARQAPSPPVRNFYHEQVWHEERGGHESGMSVEASRPCLVVLSLVPYVPRSEPLSSAAQKIPSHGKGTSGVQPSSRGDSKEVRIRVPTFSAVCFSKGTESPNQKKGEKGHYGGNLERVALPTCRRVAARPAGAPKTSGAQWPKSWAALRSPAKSIQLFVE